MSWDSGFVRDRAIAQCFYGALEPHQSRAGSVSPAWKVGCILPVRGTHETFTVKALTPGTGRFLPEAVPHWPDFYFYCFVWHVGACPGPPCLGKDSLCPTPTPSPAIWHSSSIPSSGRAQPVGSPALTSADLGCRWVVCIPPAPRMLVPTTDTALRLWISSTGHGGETGTERVTQPPKNQIPAQIHSPRLSWPRGGSL